MCNISGGKSCHHVRSAVSSLILLFAAPSLYSCRIPLTFIYPPTAQDLLLDHGILGCEPLALLLRQEIIY